MEDATPAGFTNLNDECEATNTNINGPKPYDHVMYKSATRDEIDRKFDFRVYNLIEANASQAETAATIAKLYTSSVVLVTSK